MINRRDIPAYQNRRRIIFGNDDCLYIKPHPALQPNISNYTLTFPTRVAISEQYTVIPRGKNDVYCGVCKRTNLIGTKDRGLVQTSIC